MTIGERIKYLRKKRGISADKLAELIGKDRATIYRYENKDIEKMPTSVLEPLAKALGTTPAYLMGWEDKEEANNQNDDNEDIAKVALFGGDKEVTDEMWDEVKDYIEYIKQKHFKE